MLKIHFINVAEGDSTLLEWEADGRTKFALIDTGLENVGEADGDPRISAVNFLRSRNVTEVEFIAITHLHRDHVQALGDVLTQVTPKRFYTSYVPENTSLVAPEEPETALVKVKKLAVDLNRYCSFIETMRERNTEIVEVMTNGLLYDDGVLSVSFLSPAKSRLKLQNTIFEMILSGQPVAEPIKACVAGMRNNNSLRLRVKYAGRVFGCDGDYYAEDAEREALGKCDILKVAHHGDKKSVNENVIQKLSPDYAIISWSGRYKAEKERPSANVTKWLRESGAEVYFTGPFEESGYPAEYHEEVLFTVKDDGTVVPPKRAYRVV